MKQIFLSFIVFILISCSENSFNDLDEYGLLGNVKSVKTKVYINLDQKDGEYLVNENQLALERTINFNKDGNIETWESRYYVDHQVITDTKVKFSHKDGKKWKNTVVGDTSLSAVTYFIWENDYEYDFGDTSESGLIYNTHTKISKDNGRDLSGEYKAWSEGELVAHEEYINELEGNRIVSATENDYLKNTSTVFKVVYLKEDSHGNPTEYYIFNTTTNSLKEYHVKKIEYY